MIHTFLQNEPNQTLGARVWLVVIVALLLRVLMGFFPYSGEHESPNFGDYEAQRHWMEITVNLPPSAWYTDSEHNDRSWWPLDYPPLSAYHEYVLGLMSDYMHPSSISLGDSRGYETGPHRFFMRVTVLLSDMLVYIPAVLFFWRSIISGGSRFSFGTFVLLLLNPMLIYIDHGHFQYNSVAIGLVMFSVVSLFEGRIYSAAFLYTLSFLFKQTMLYFAPAFFAILLGQSLKLPTLPGIIRRVSLLGLVVVFTVLIAMLPVLFDCRSGVCAQQRVDAVLKRVFPFWRGVFEDYVANFWVSISPIVRLRHASVDMLSVVRFISTLVTLFASAVPCWAILRRPLVDRFPLALACVSLSFYLFSWLVHEKAILLPFTLVLAVVHNEIHRENFPVLLSLLQACFLSCVPLMVTEKSTLGATGVMLLGLSVFKGIMTGGKRTSRSAYVTETVQLVFNTVGLIGAICLLWVSPPHRYPYLWQLVIAVSCCVTFVVSWVHLVRQIHREENRT